RATAGGGAAAFGPAILALVVLPEVLGRDRCHRAEVDGGGVAGPVDGDQGDAIEGAVVQVVDPHARAGARRLGTNEGRIQAGHRVVALDHAGCRRGAQAVVGVARGQGGEVAGLGVAEARVEIGAVLL